MKLWSRLKSSFRNPFRKFLDEDQLDDKVHGERNPAGMSAFEVSTAQVRSGVIEQIKQPVRDHRDGARMELFWQDARFGLRQLWKNPGFSFSAIVALRLASAQTQRSSLS
jgi:hypothetical protein